ncbi:MAG: tyrosine/phenylalanine carboxypeptidase domain-containing protein, partial [Patescibacteria group bacterium]
MWFFHNPGLLGINARNLLYIKPYNPRKAIMMADSKIKTKNYLSARGIPVAKLYNVISRKKELSSFDFNSLPNSFVVKPNAGYGGEGILIVKGRKGRNFVRENGEIVSIEEMENHISDIVDGRYSIADMSDAALFEQLLEAPDFLQKMAYKGLPDIRIVVHNLIPVMAMLRLPTESSGGKANIHMGGIGVGIDIAKGELTFATQYDKVIDSIPGFGDPKGMKIPQWEDFLLIASRVQHITNLGFAAVDMVLDRNMGPVLLEINARAGLQVQVANMAPLRRRLERVEGIKVNSPEKGVRIAQDIFGIKIEAKSEKGAGKTIIGTMERAEVIGKKGTAKIIAQAEPEIEKSVLDRKIADAIGLDQTGKCKFSLMDQKVMTVVDTRDLADKPYDMLIGQRDLRNFLIDPSKNVLSATEERKKEAPHIARVFTEKELHKIDFELADIDSQIRLLSHLKPANLIEENTKFLLDPGYNPQFTYRELSFDPNNFYSRLKRLEFPDSPIGILWSKKADEITRKIHLLESRDTPEFTEKSIKLYGGPDAHWVREALSEIHSMPKEFKDGGKIFTAKEAKKFFEKAIQDYGLKGWRVKLKEALVSDAIAGKENTILIRENATFTAVRLKGTIAHEIETHAFTAMNGALQPYKLFQRGLADYLTTEEGLAVYNQELTESSETIKRYWPASSVIGIDEAMRGSFTDVYKRIVELGFGAERAWRVAPHPKDPGRSFDPKDTQEWYSTKNEGKKSAEKRGVKNR